MNHEHFMHRCLELAERGRGKVGTNPLVGSVLVREGHILAEGWHEAFGLPHAEQKLFSDFEGEVLPDDILYVNLEPCDHYGKTPPCTDLLLVRGVKKVCIGMKDPNPEVSGKGISRLRSGRVEIIGPVSFAHCLGLNKGFVSLHTQGRPWITVKKAQTKDGDYSTPDKRLMITSEEQNIWAHENLRAKRDAILVGIGTILADDPILNTRFVQNKKVDQFSPLRFVLDPFLKIELNAQVLTVNPEKTMIICSIDENAEKKQQIRELGASVFEYDFENPMTELLKKLGTAEGNYLGVSSLLVEGGPKTWAAFENAGLLDEQITLVGD